MSLPDVLLKANVLWTAPDQMPPPARSHRITSYQAVRQCQSQWCWAAVVLELMRCRKMKAPEEVPDDILSLHKFVAKSLTGKVDCSAMAEDCDADVPLHCNQVEDIETYLKTLQDKQSGTALKEKELSEALDADLPVVASFKFNNSRHYVVITGLAKIDGHQYLEITDSDEARRIDQISFEFGQAVRHPDGWDLETVFFTKDGW